MRSGWFAACAVVLLASGCVTPAALEGLEDMGQVGLETRRYEAVEVLVAARTGDGAYHLRVRYGDGVKRNLVYEPTSGPPRESGPRRPRRIDGPSMYGPDMDAGDLREGWPAVGGSGRVAFSGEEFPANGAPLAIGDGGGAPGLPCVRLRDGHLERCEGSGYLRVGRTPLVKRRERTWVTYFAEGAFATFVVPLAVATDLAIGAAYVLAHMR